MPRHNKIYAGPFTEPTPQVRELPAAASTLPGSLLVINAGKFALAGDTSTGKIFVAQDNYLVGKGVDDAIPADQVLIGMNMLDEQFFNLRFATGVNIALGAAIGPGANGKAALAAAGDQVIGYAEEAYNNTSGSDQLVRVRACAAHRLPAA